MNDLSPVLAPKQSKAVESCRSLCLPPAQPDVNRQAYEIKSPRHPPLPLCKAAESFREIESRGKKKEKDRKTAYFLLNFRAFLGIRAPLISPSAIFRGIRRESCNLRSTAHPINPSPGSRPFQTPDRDSSFGGLRCGLCPPEGSSSCLEGEAAPFSAVAAARQPHYRGGVSRLSRRCTSGLILSGCCCVRRRSSPPHNRGTPPLAPPANLLEPHRRLIAGAGERRLKPHLMAESRRARIAAQEALFRLLTDPANQLLNNSNHDDEEEEDDEEEPEGVEELRPGTSQSAPRKVKPLARRETPKQPKIIPVVKKDKATQHDQLEESILPFTVRGMLTEEMPTEDWKPGVGKSSELL
ncbi:zinc finger protein CKR1-like [Crotalus adamanteus]|uniref:Zinc finger protein CKR1-like n=1 Tax=Crotalus adamanteus TaxID=8729 RepID=A0AAW1BUU3_CROAD